jgi:6-phosphogluconate dehydrogenase
MKRALQIGMIGLGRMGANMTRRLARGGAQVIAFDRAAPARRALSRERRVSTVADLASMLQGLKAPRVIWLMLPSGKASADTLAQLIPLLAKGDVLVDGANANYKDSMRRAAELSALDIYYVDAGVSGGVWGLANGYTIMLGGETRAVRRVTPFAKLLAPPKGWMHCGPSGAGHYVKMIHNGIEYGLMQAYAEGFALLEGKKEFKLDLAAVAELWRHGSVVRSWLLDLMADMFKRDAALEGIAPMVADSGEGRWTAIEAIELGVPAPVISLALAMRFASQGQGDYGAKQLAQLRNSFGGHAVSRSKRPAPADRARGGRAASKQKKP